MKGFLCKLGLLTLFGVYFFSAPFAHALITYERTSAGTEITSPILINVSVDNFSDFGLAEGSNFWAIAMSDGVDTWFGEGFSNTTLSVQQNFSLPIGTEINEISISGYSQEPLIDDNQLSSSVLESNGGGKIFTIIAGGSSVAGDLFGPMSYPPSVEITSPQDRDLFSNKIPITYRATDKFGFINLPVSIFYLDKFTDSNQAIIPDENKTLIAKDLPVSGTYAWKGTNLLEGKFYKIIVYAVNTAGKIGQMLSGYFQIDLTPPTFIVSADPPIAKEENVTITIESSEDLAAPPEVFVRQRGASPAKVEVTGGEKKFSGVYSAKGGFDGNASIGVNGIDIAGNKGSVIVGGGTFSVGVNPPGKPVILSPADNEKVTSEIVTITGSTREDTEIIATVNGVDVYKTSVDSNGEFLIKNVQLKKNMTNGINIINVVAKDRLGSLGEAAVIHISLNLAPTILLLKPEPNAVLAATKELSVRASDANGDHLRFLYEIAGTGKTAPQAGDWQVIADTPNDNIDFNTTEFSDGAYLIRVTADDGATTTISSLINIRLKNELPFIGFDDGRRTVISGKTATVHGVVSAPENLFPQPNIIRLEYSTTSGEKWMTAAALDGVFNSPEERFFVIFQNLKNGVNDIIWRATDSRNFIAKARHPIIVDTVPPEQPKISSPANGSILTETNNETSDKGKFSFTLRGKSESGSTVNLEMNGKKFTGKAAFDGTFRVANITLPARGNYIVKVYATDEALNKSTEAELSLLYDNPPILVFTNPRDGRGVPQNATLSWLASDPDGDAILNGILSYRRIGQPFIVLAKNLKENKFDWDTTKLAEGNDYELKLETSDGLTTSTVRTSFGIDHSPPLLSAFTAKQSVYGKGGTFEAVGAAEDDSSGIEFVEYRFVPMNAADSKISPETPWYKGIVNRGFLGKNASFSIKSRMTLLDGEYKVVSRAVDAAGNVSSEKFQNITVDGTPPRVGSLTIANGTTKLQPKDKVFDMTIGAKLALTLSLEKDTKSAFLTVEKKQAELTKNLSTGLWQGEFSVSTAGTSTIFISAVDNIGNKLEKQEIAFTRTVAKGKITFINEKGIEETLSGATVVASRTDGKLNFFSRWLGVRPREKHLSGDDGNYDLFLPAGTYQISVEKSGFETKETEPIVLSAPAFITDNFVLMPSAGNQSLFKWLLKMLNL